jgi:hypothetical protein
MTARHTHRGPYVVFGFVIVLILGLAWVWDSAGQQRRARYAPPEESAGGAPDSGRTVAAAFLLPPLDLPHYHGIDLDNETSTREVTGA